MDTELLEAEELDVDQTRSARHERPAAPRSRTPLPTSTRSPPNSGPHPALDGDFPDRHVRYGHAGDPWKNGP